MKRTRITYKTDNGKNTFIRQPLQRQAIVTSAQELRKIADDIEKETSEIYEKLKIPLDKKPAKQRTLVSIINRSKCSDTWKFEHH
jgi:hypothetical protein